MLLQNKCPYYELNCSEDKCECVKYKAYIAASNPENVKVKLNELGLDINVEPWELLMGMQKKFASKFHKVDDLKKEEMDYWIDKYLICIEDEIREVREHLKIYPEDVQNNELLNNNTMELKKELIDILHFIMDEFICGGATAEIIKKYYLKLYNPNIANVNDILAFAYDNQYNEIKNLYSNSNKDIAMLLMVNKLLDCSGKVRQCISWKHWKKSADSINFELLYTAFAETFKSLIDLFAYMDMDSEEIKHIYITKNVENIYRQELGYNKKSK